MFCLHSTDTDSNNSEVSMCFSHTRTQNFFYINCNKASLFCFFFRFFYRLNVIFSIARVNCNFLTIIVLLRILHYGQNHSKNSNPLLFILYEFMYILFKIKYFWFLRSLIFDRCYQQTYQVVSCK